MKKSKREGAAPDIIHQIRATDPRLQQGSFKGMLHSWYGREPSEVRSSVQIILVCYLGPNSKSIHELPIHRAMAKLVIYEGSE